MTTLKLLIKAILILTVIVGCPSLMVIILLSVLGNLDNPILVEYKFNILFFGLVLSGALLLLSNKITINTTKSGGSQT
jgi:hypothetical protein